MCFYSSEEGSVVYHTVRRPHMKWTVQNLLMSVSLTNPCSIQRLWNQKPSCTSPYINKRSPVKHWLTRVELNNWQQQEIARKWAPHTHSCRCSIVSTLTDIMHSLTPVLNTKFIGLFWIWLTGHHKLTQVWIWVWMVICLHIWPICMVMDWRMFTLWPRRPLAWWSCIILELRWRQ